MRQSLIRGEPIIIKALWKNCERPSRSSLRRILSLYLSDVEIEGNGGKPISLPSFKYLLGLVAKDEGYLLVLLQEDSLAIGNTSIYQIMDRI